MSVGAATNRSDACGVRSRLPDQGIVTRSDLVRAYARPDEQLSETLRDDVLRRLPRLDLRRFAVGVADGQAWIQGRVDRRSTAEVIGRAVAMVPGIVDVRPNHPFG